MPVPSAYIHKNVFLCTFNIEKVLEAQIWMAKG